MLRPEGQDAFRMTSLRGGVMPFAMILFLFVGLQISYAPGRGPYSNDGDYYVHLARHVARGDGLVTSVSLYHQGLRTLPQSSTIYPLWPLTLGYVGRMIGMTAAANVLPPLLFAVDLVFLYLTTNRLAKRIAPGAFPIFERDGVSLEPGHLVALVFASSPVFFDATSKPYTEGLAFAFALGALLLLDEATSRNRGPLWFLAGLLSGLAYLTRYQMIGFVAAMLAVLVLFASLRRISLGSVFMNASGFLIAVLPWVAFLTHKSAQYFPQILIGAHAYRESDLPGFEGEFRFASRRDYLFDRARGVIEAFDVRSPDSFFSAFGFAVLAVPIAALVFLLWQRRQRTPLFSLDSLPIWASLLAGLILCAMLVPIHLHIGPPRLFGSRHGLVFVFLLIPSVAYLASFHRKTVRVSLLCAILLSAALGVAAILDSPVPPGTGIGGGHGELLAWLRARDPHAVVLTTRAQTYAAYSDLRLHWAWPQDPPETTLEMIRKLPIEYAAIEQGESSLPFVRGLVGTVLVSEAEFGSQGLRVRLYRINRPAVRQAVSTR